MHSEIRIGFRHQSMTKKLGQRAIVVGASMAGLMTARVLSEYFDQVLAIDRDEIEDRPVVHKSVPQGHHLHAFLQGGLNVVSSLYPSITEELRRLGATRIAMGRNAVWYTPNGKAYNFTGSVRTPFDCGLEGYCASRGLLEFVIRRRTSAISNIHFEYGTTITELICRDATVVGVRTADSRSIEADLVVDATGRAHRARQWLAAIGFSSPDETEIGLDTAYSTANFRRHESFSGEPLIFITGPAPHFTRRGYVITIENGTLLVSLIGRFGDFPPTDKEGFIAFAKELHSDLAYRIVKDGEQLTAIAHQRFVSSVQRHYERMGHCPQGFVVIGDALCHFNPIYAQGMSAAAKQVEILQEILSDSAKQSRGLNGIASSFFTQAAEFNSTPWNLAAGADFAFPQTRGVRPPGTAEQARYFQQLDKLAQEDSEVLRLMTEVFHLVQPLSILREEPLRSRVLGRLAN
jgi:2-polyprenyl-6-methoxyphenol hydroxylase-like FAD-dependent oxidoreductase